jgi:hypothetical protein
MARQLSESGLQLRVLSQSPRRLGGLEGTETLTEAAETGKAPTLTYTWSHPGVPADSLRPRIVVRASAPSNRREALDALWAMVAGSLRMRAAGTP